MDSNTTENNSNAQHNKLLLSWRAPEFIPHAKSDRWFIAAGIALVLIVIYAIYTKSASMAIVFIMLGGVYYLTHNQQPKIIDVQITELGVRVDKTFYPYNMIHSFWIVYHPPFVQTLNLKLGDKSLTRLTIQLDNQNPVEVRKALATEVPEVEGQGESTFDMLTRLLRL